MVTCQQRFLFTTSTFFRINVLFCYIEKHASIELNESFKRATKFFELHLDLNVTTI